MQTQVKTMFAAETPALLIPAELHARIQEQLDLRFSRGDIRRGYFRHGAIDRSRGEPEPLWMNGRGHESYLAGWNWIAVADPLIEQREQFAEMRAKERLRARIDAQLDAEGEALTVACRKGLHPRPFEVRGGYAYCRYCGRKADT